MYVSGRGTHSYGTILPALYEWRRRGGAGEMFIAGTRPQGIELLRHRVRELDALTGLTLRPDYFPSQNRTSTDEYLRAITLLPRPGCAIVVVPDHLHKEVAAAAIEAGLHALVVKPLTPTVRDTLELLELQRRHHVYCAVEFHKRFDRSNVKLRDTIAQGLVGDPLYFVVEYSQRRSVPAERFRAWVDKTNVFQYLGVHYVDIIHFVTGARPVRALAIGQKDWLAAHGTAADDAIQALVEWETPSRGRFASLIITNWIDPETTSAMSDQTLKVIGTLGRYEADQKRRGIQVVTGRQGVEEPNPDFCALYGHEPGQVHFEGYGIDSVLQFLRDVSAIEDGSLTIEELDGKRPTFRDSLPSVAVVEAVRQSLAAGGAWIDISPTPLPIAVAAPPDEDRYVDVRARS